MRLQHLGILKESQRVTGEKADASTDRHRPEFNDALQGYRYV